MENTPEIFRKLLNRIITVRANLFVARPGERTSMHRHPNRWHISHTIRGHGIVTINNIRHEMRPNNIIMIYPGEPHIYAADPDNPYTVQHVHIDCAGAIPAVFPRSVKTAEIDKALPALFSRLVRLTHHSTSPTRIPRLEAGLLNILAELYDAGRRQDKNHADTPMPDTEITLEFAAVLDRLRQAPFSFPGIDTLAGLTHMSRRTFTRVFRQTTGMSVHAYYTSEMMIYARRLMDLKEYTLKEIAWQCGYANSQNFHRAYNRHAHPDKQRGIL